MRETAEIETPVPAAPESQLPVKAPAPGTSLVERMLVDGNTDPLERIQRLTKVLDILRRESIRATYPGDWIIHISRDNDGNITRTMGYLQDCGAERAGKVWGIQIERPTIEREDFGDGTYCYNLLADAFSRVTGETIQNVEGSRWSGDKFFSRSVGPDEKVDPTDVRKSAWANLHGRAVRQLGGLNAVPVDMLEACGLDPKKIVHVDYQKGGKGGESSGASVGAGSGGADIEIKWGDGKGKKVAELTGKQLAFYHQKAEEDLKDDAKKKFHKVTQQLLNALNAEMERRARAAEQKADAAPEGSAPTAAYKNRGEKQSACFKRFADLARTVGGGVTGSRLLAALTQDGHENFSDVTEEELDRLLTLSPEVLMQTATDLAG